MGTGQPREVPRWPSGERRRAVGRIGLGIPVVLTSRTKSRRLKFSWGCSQVPKVRHLGVEWDELCTERYP